MLARIAANGSDEVQTESCTWISLPHQSLVVTTVIMSRYMLGGGFNAWKSGGLATKFGSYTVTPGTFPLHCVYDASSQAGSVAANGCVVHYAWHLPLLWWQTAWKYKGVNVARLWWPVALLPTDPRRLPSSMHAS